MNEDNRVAGGISPPAPTPLLINWGPRLALRVPAKWRDSPSLSGHSWIMKK